MGNLSKSKTLFSFTSPRTIEKIVPEIKLLAEKFSGQKWRGNLKLQAEYFQALFDSDFYEGEALPQDLAFAARDRITRTPKALGFVDLTHDISLSKAGKALLKGKRIDEVIARQLLKFQLPSPNHTPSSKINFSVKPYLELLRLTQDLEGISTTEIALFFTQLTDYRNYDVTVAAIKSFRLQGKANKTNRKAFVEQAFQHQLSKIYAVEMSAGNTATRESVDATAAKFLATKRGNLRDYADAFMRYLRATKLVTFDIRSSRLKIAPSRQADVDFILQAVARHPEDYSDTEAFNAYLFDDQLPKLLSDDRSALMRRLGIFQAQLDSLQNSSIEALKDHLEELESKASFEQVLKVEKSLKNFTGIEDLDSVFKQIVNKEIPDAPLYLEWNIWRAMVMLNDAISIEGNFKRDLEGVPLNSAPGNCPDIQCCYADFNLLVEVTLSTGRKQFEMEGEPVAHHFGQIKKAMPDKPTYCLFVANTLNPGAVAHFFNLNRFKTAAYGGQTSIVPVDLTTFRAMLNQAKIANLQDSRYLKNFLHTMVEQGRNAEDETHWLGSIQAYAQTWCEVQPR